MKYLILKDRRRRILYALYERRHNVLLSLVQNVSLLPAVRAQAYRVLLQLPRESSITRIRNRCSLTGRSRAVYRRFGVSRLRFRKLAWEGQLSGVKKAS
jgi:ribosomal protein S14